MKKTLVLSLLTLFMVPLVTSGASQKSKPITVVSYNIRMSGADQGEHSWQNRRESTIAMLKAVRPDLVGMQEVVSDQYDYISRNMGSEYGMLGVGRDDGKRAGEFMAVMYKKERFELLDHGHFWLSETPAEVSRGWDGACNRMVTWMRLTDISTEKEVYFFNTHFDHKGQAARQESAKLISEMIQEMVGKKTTLILTGDFNAEPDDPVLAPIAEYMSSAREHAMVSDSLGTYHGWGTTTKDHIIDHIYYRNAEPQVFITLTDGYGSKFISDHYPVSAIFLLK